MDFHHGRRLAEEYGHPSGSSGGNNFPTSKPKCASKNNPVTQGTWMDQLPFKARYETLIRALCQTTDTPLVDFSRAIPDEAFVDSNHLTVEGQQQFRNLIIGEITNHLQNAQTNSVPEIQTKSP